MRDTLSDAVQLGVPIVVGVPDRNINSGVSLQKASPRNARWVPLGCMNGSCCTDLT